MVYKYGTWRHNTDGEKLHDTGRALSHRHTLKNANTTYVGLGSKTDLRGVRTVTIRLSHGTVSLKMVI